MRETLNSENEQQEDKWAVQIKTQFQVEEHFKGCLTWEENRLQTEEV